MAKRLIRQPVYDVSTFDGDKERVVIPPITMASIESDKCPTFLRFISEHGFSLYIKRDDISKIKDIREYLDKGDDGYERTSQK